MTEEEIEWATGDWTIFADLLPDAKTRKAMEEKKKREEKEGEER